MNSQKQQRIWESNLTSTQKLVLLAYSFVNDSAPSYATIATMTSMAKRTVISTVSDLCEMGLMGKIHRQKEDGSLGSNHYEIYLHNIRGHHE